MSVKIEQVTSEAVIGQLVPEWQALWRRAGDATPFQSPEWLLSWWRFFGNGAPLVLTAREHERLIAVLPLYHHAESGCAKLLPIGVGLSDYLDALVEAAHSGTVEALLQALLEQPRWEECYIPDLPPFAALLAARPPAQLLQDRRIGETCPVLTLPTAVSGLPEVVPRKTLRDLGQARRRAAVAGSIAAIPADEGSLAEFLQEFFRLHEDRWQPIAGHGVCSDPAVRNFHLAAARRMLSAGILRLYLLRIGNSVVSAYYGFTAKRIAYAYLSGFDHRFAALSPGTQIIAHAIEEAVREGAREFHFLRGGEAYKYAWGAVDRPNTVLTLRRWC
ncbi:MAG: GNAT family N-acetyltransferase [Alphaproteobacteria bacterium]|nr:GNAT family N-acetyltransferase [Alphaproteobacteria bacterium]MBV9199151.1 GNAT family N-acetyltransferase [Alphaproteobacteria bacterium]MBV9375152.1 GNAT family N-acetyltransferase [Alphaproteobacteria bacterium]